MKTQWTMRSGPHQTDKKMMKNNAMATRLDHDTVEVLKTNPRQIPLFRSSDLFGDQHEIMICHRGEIYTIRITRNGKLIMNK
jgi:hemin uptake protein HemP